MATETRIFVKNNLPKGEAICVCRKLEAIEEQLYQEIRKFLIRVVAMLTKMAKKET